MAYRFCVAGRAARQGDERDIAAARGDRLGGMGHVQDGGGAAALGGVDMAQFQAQVFGDRGGAQTGRVAGAEIAVHVVLGEARILQRALGALGVDLRGGLVGGVAERMLVGAHDVGLALNAHVPSRIMLLMNGDRLIRAGARCHPQS